MLRSNEKKRHLDALSNFNSIPQFGSRYMAAVLADTPIIYWPGQDFSGHLRSLSTARTGGENITNFDSTTETTLTYRVTPGPFKDGTVCVTKGSGGKATRHNVTVAVNNCSLEGWFNLTSGVGSNRLLMSVDGTLKGWGVLMTSATHYAVIVQNVAFQANNTAALATGTWYHIVCVREAGTWKYYLNGAGDNTSAGTGLPVANDDSLGIGIGRDATVQVFNWAHFAYYETALTSGNVSTHYNAAIQ